MTNDEQNRTIHSWLGAGCWHEMKGGGFQPAYCVNADCGWRLSIAQWRAIGGNVNPDYSTWAGMELLLAGLEKKGCSWKLALYVGYSCHIWTVGQRSTTDEPVASEIAGTLPDALASAVLKLIAAESNAARQPDDGSESDRNGENKNV